MNVVVGFAAVPKILLAESQIVRGSQHSHVGIDHSQRRIDLIAMRSDVKFITTRRQQVRPRGTPRIHSVYDPVVVLHEITVGNGRGQVHGHELIGAIVISDRAPEILVVRTRVDQFNRSGIFDLPLAVREQPPAQPEDELSIGPVRPERIGFDQEFKDVRCQLESFVRTNSVLLCANQVRKIRMIDVRRPFDRRQAGSPRHAVSPLQLRQDFRAVVVIVDARKAFRIDGCIC